MTFKRYDVKMIFMKIPINVDKVSGKIVAVRVDGKMSYNYTPEYVPYGSKVLSLEVQDIIVPKGNHVIEIITEKGNYLKAKFVV